MLAYDHQRAPAAPALPLPAQFEVDQPLGGQVQHGLNLFLPLKVAVPDAGAAGPDRRVRRTRWCSRSSPCCDYVHFARFLPSPDGIDPLGHHDLRRALAATSWTSSAPSATCSPRCSTTSRARRRCPSSATRASSSPSSPRTTSRHAECGPRTRTYRDRHPRAGGDGHDHRRSQTCRATSARLRPSFDCARHFALGIGDAARRAGLPGRPGRRRHLDGPNVTSSAEWPPISGRRAA